MRARGEEDAGRHEQRAARPGEAIADQRHGEPTEGIAKRLMANDELTGVRVRPAALGERVGQPGRVAVVDAGRGRRRAPTNSQATGVRSGKRARLPTGLGGRLCAWPRATRRASRRPRARRRASAPARNPPQSASGTASAVASAAPSWMPAGVDAGDEQRAIGEALLHGHHHERVAEPHADADRDRQRDHGRTPRAATERARPPPAISASAIATARDGARRARPAAPPAARTRPCRSPGSP